VLTISYENCYEENYIQVRTVESRGMCVIYYRVVKEGYVSHLSITVTKHLRTSLTERKMFILTHHLGGFSP
jgi:hypothetical protein